MPLIGDLSIPGNTDAIADDYLNRVAIHDLLSAHYHPTIEGNCLNHVMVQTTHKAKTLILDNFITDHARVFLSCS